MPRGLLTTLLVTTAVASLLAAPSTAAAPAPVAAATAPTVAVAPRAWTPVPSYAVAAIDEPITYRNGCHASRYTVTPRACTFAKATSKRTVMLFGDSHAAHWHAAVLASANARGWRMLTLTKSSCAAADVNVQVYKTTTPYTECTAWRDRALPAVARSAWGKVDVVVVSNWHFHTVLSQRWRRLTAEGKTTAWEAGMTRTLTQLLKGAKQVVILRDSPDLPGDAASARACYRTYGLAAETRCGSASRYSLHRGVWDAEKRAAAKFPGRVVVADLTTPTCGKGWCGPIDGKYLAFKDDNHWTQTYMKAHFTQPVDALLGPAMVRATTG